MEYFSNSQKQTEYIAAEFAKRLKAGDVVALFGDLGAGKTAFVRGIARALGVSEHVTSPTFVILNEYEGDTTLYHFDMYRLEDADEDALSDVGYFEYAGGDGVCAIEWSEYIKDFLPDDRYDVTITLTDGDERARRIIITRAGGAPL
ncbi:MAG: tRNA (adenosine(37)-N6)-threonylcarbamoyltransferase complex ATPase subunit type 1 TsaE [Clostridia bacterium]|nr:tRNA (adenosine(37)-N6)-threonylcarbamoyltransferase complex ATPase subunit type 1 TsaE [Clostridia bacterium]